MRRRRSPARWLAPIALVACAVAVYTVVNATLLSSDEPAATSSTGKTTTAKSGTVSQRLEERQAPHDAPPADLHRQVRRHAVVDLGEDRRLARAHPGAQPQARLQVASDRPAGQAVAVTAAARRAAGALVVALALLAVAVATAAAPARAQAAGGPVVRAPAAILVEPATGDVVFQRKARDERPVASTTKLMTALLTLERMKLSTTVHGDPLPRRAGRVGDRPARRRAPDRRRPHARPAARQRERRRRDARRPRRRHARALRAPDEPPRAPARPARHALRQPDRARRGGQPLERRGPRQAHADPAAQRVLPRA